MTLLSFVAWRKNNIICYSMGCAGDVPLRSKAVEGFVHDDTFVINALRREQVVRGVPVAHLDENGHGI